MGRQLGDETVGQRLDTIFLLGGLGTRRRSVAADGDHRALDIAVVLGTFGRFAVGVRLGWRFVLGTDIAALDAQIAVALDADEGARTRSEERRVGNECGSHGRSLWLTVQ